MKYAICGLLLVVSILCFKVGRDYQSSENEIRQLSEQRYKLSLENEKLRNKIDQQQRELTRTLLEINVIKNDVNIMHQLLREKRGNPNKGGLL